MNDRRCLGAYTSFDSTAYPPYINFTEELDHTVTVTVRGPARAVHTPEGVFPITGPEVAYTMPRRDFAQLLQELVTSLNRKPS